MSKLRQTSVPEDMGHEMRTGTPITTAAATASAAKIKEAEAMPTELTAAMVIPNGVVDAMIAVKRLAKPQMMNSKLSSLSSQFGHGVELASRDEDTDGGDS